jgi:hypothetical protein
MKTVVLATQLLRFEKQKSDRAFFCYLYSKENRWNTPFTDYEDVGLDPGLDLCRVGYIEKIANK